jgi:hypothetical protein
MPVVRSGPDADVRFEGASRYFNGTSTLIVAFVGCERGRSALPQFAEFWKRASNCRTP